MQSMGAIIASHNIKMWAPAPTDNAIARTCNCGAKTSCPLDGQCLTSAIVYKASVSAQTKPTKVYYGVTEGPFKDRYRSHTKPFGHMGYSADTELSKYVWDLKDAELDASIRWEIAQRSVPYQCGSRKCDLCISEKSIIALADSESLLNKRTELVSCCRHRSKFTCAKALSSKQPRGPNNR